MKHARRRIGEAAEAVVVAAAGTAAIVADAAVVVAADVATAISATRAGARSPGRSLERRPEKDAPRKKDAPESGRLLLYRFDPALLMERSSGGTLSSSSSPFVSISGSPSTTGEMSPLKPHRLPV